MSDMDLNKAAEELATRFQGSVATTADGKFNVTVPSESMTEVAEVVRNEMNFDLLHDVSGLDHPDSIEIVYHLYRTSDHNALVLRASVSRDGGSIATVTPVWVTANWHERETAELYGVEFIGHPDPRKLLLADDFPGFPLRKDWSHDDIDSYLLSDA